MTEVLKMSTNALNTCDFSVVSERSVNLRILGFLGILLVMLIIPVHGAVIVVPDNKTIQEVIDSASDGDTVVVRDGVYSVYLNITKSITLRSENGTANCILEASTNDDVIEVHADFVTITGFTIRYGNDDGVDIEPLNGDPSDHINISNNVFYNLYGGIQIEDSNYTVVMDNNFTAVETGVYIYGSSYFNTIVNNTIRDATSYGIDMGSGKESEIYLNRFINNSVNARDCGRNHWNSTEMHQYAYQGNVFTNYTGNYWDDYVGADSNGDGIGDTPYNISSEWCGEEGGGADGGRGGGGIPLPIGGSGSASQSKDYYPMLFETLQPPAISNVRVSDVTNSSATIRWDVSLAANNRVLFSTNSDLSSPQWSAWDNSTDSPMITLSGLSAGTAYYFSVYSFRPDNASLYSNSSIMSFTTIRNPKTWYVDDDGQNCSADFASIQDAVNASIDGDTIVVCNGTYVENIVVNRTLNITGMGNPVVEANNSGSGFTLKSNGNIIQGFTIKNASYGECYGYVKHGGIKVGYTTYEITGLGDCTQITDFESTDNVIRNNRFVNGGVVLVKGYISSGSNRNTITGNIFESSMVTIEQSSYNEISFNTFLNQTSYGYIVVEGAQYRKASHNTIHGNRFVKYYQSTMPAIWIKSYADYTNISGNILEGYGGIAVSSNGCVIADNIINGFTPILEDDDGIKLNHVSNCILVNNTVNQKYAGVKIDTSSMSAFSTNITMRDNSLLQNTYDFYFDAGEIGDYEIAPVFEDFNHDIDTSNVVTGGAIYFLKNASDLVLDHSANPPVGFFACANCKNITLKNLGLSSNSHGIILYNTSHSAIESVGAYYNHLAGLAAYYSSNITITNSTFEWNGDRNEAAGVFLGKSENVAVEKSEINSNWCYGIEFSYSSNNTVRGANITDNGPYIEFSPIADDCYSGGSGVKLYESEGNTITSSYIKAKKVPIHGAWRGGQKYGIHSTSSSGNLIYNNYFFNHSVNAYDTGNNRWNVTPTADENIIGGPYLGGNYWHDYAGEDVAGGDGLGDTLLPYNSGGNIQNGGDYHPLTNPNPDFRAPAIYVVSPVEGRTYSANYVYLEVYSPDPDVDRWWYSLNSGANVTFTPNTTISGLSNGNYNLRVYVNDTAGNLNSTIVNFSISISSGGGAGGGAGGGGGGVKSPPPLEEVVEPEFEIKIINPKNEEYVERELDLNFVSTVPLARASFILDDGSAERIDIPLFATSGSVKLTRLSLGEHRIIVNGEDYYGKKGRGEVEFKIVPLALGEVSIAGTETTPRFVEDVAFSFFGRDCDYILQFEAKGDARIDVHVNQFYRDGVMQYNDLQGGMVFSFTPTQSYQVYEVPISNVSADVENIISFISENAESGGEEGWVVRNVTLIPNQNVTFPQITVFTFDRAISANETMQAYLKVDGASEGYEGYVYLLTPLGRKLYYPDWSEEERPIDGRYLKLSYYGKLPSTLDFDGMEEGTYLLVGKIVDSYGKKVSVSTEKIYHSQKVSVKLYVNRDVFSRGQEILVEHMLTGSQKNGTLMVSLESPDGDRIYLPVLSEEPEIKNYAPIHSDYFVALNEIVADWTEGTYILRSSLYNESGELLDDDITTFHVCFKDSTVEGTYLRYTDDTSPIVLSRIRLIDFYTMDFEEMEISGNHYDYSFTIKPGKYYLTGEAYSGSGKVYRIPLTLISADCGRKVTRNLELEFLYERSSSGLEMWGLEGRNLVEKISEKYIRLEGISACSKPKVGVAVVLDDTALDMLRDDIKLLYGIEGFEEADKAKISSFLAARATEFVRSTSPEVEVYSVNDLIEVLNQAETALRNPGMPDYFYVIKIGGDMHYYHITADLQEFPQRTILPETYYYVTEVSNPLDNVGLIIQRTGDLRQIIDDFEMKRPVPPRDPRIEIKVVPDSVSPDSEESREATIYAKVTDCRGKPAVWISESLGNVLRRQEVYFQKETERGVVRADWEATKVSTEGEIVSSNQWVIGDTRTAGEGIEGGTAVAKYTLKEGIEAGEDLVKVVTFGRGMKKATAVAVIKINGVKMDVKAEREILPRHSTFVEVSLYRENEKGEREPLAGKSIVVGRNQLLDGRLTPAGVLDASGNPVTDENGVAKLKYTAGEKEGLARMSFEYRSELGVVRDSASIKVKEKEFTLFIKWSAISVTSLSGTEELSHSMQALCCPDDSECHWETDSGSYSKTLNEARGHSYFFTSQTTWKQGGEDERTTATFIQSKFYNSENSGGGSSSFCDNSVSSSSSSQGSFSGTVSAHVGDVKTEMVYETPSGDLLVCIAPVPLSFSMKGSDSHTYSSVSTVSWSSSKGSGSETYSYSDSGGCQYDGNPETNPTNLREGCHEGNFAEVQNVWVETYPSVTDKNPFWGCIILEKVGEDRWEEVRGQYNVKRSTPSSTSYTWDCGYRECQMTRSYTGSRDVTYEGNIEIRVVKK